jgi:hypothetical protein
MTQAAEKPLSWKRVRPSAKGASHSSPGHHPGDANVNQRGLKARSIIFFRNSLKTYPNETTDSITVVIIANFLLPFSAQKSHVKSQNHLNPTNKTRSSWHFS